MFHNFNPLELIIALVPLLFAVIIHEIAHGYIALLMGDPTAKLAGRLTLNPVRHIDPFGSILLPLIFKLSGAPIVFGYAKPVPVNFLNLRPRRAGIIAVSAAGVVSNFILAIVSGGLVRIIMATIPMWSKWSQIYGGIPAISLIIFLKILIYSTQINLVLAFFNLIPILPLDGGRILAALLPAHIQHNFARTEPLGMVILILLLLTKSLDPLFSFIINPLIKFFIGSP